MAACVSSAEQQRRAAAKLAMEEQQRKDWAALTPAQRVQFSMMREAEERERKRQRAHAVGQALQNMADAQQRAAWENQQRYEANRSRTYRVQDMGYGNYRITPQGY